MSVLKKIVFKEKTYHNIQEELINAINETGVVHYMLELKFNFSEPVSVHRRRWTKPKKSFITKFFFPETEGIAFKYSARCGRRLSDMVHSTNDLKKLNSVEIRIFQKTDRNKAKGRLIEKIHPNAWPELKEGFKNDPDSILKYQALDRIYMKSIFPKSVISSLENAFENKCSYRYNLPARGPQGRDRSVNVKLCDDGILRAWYSSEYYMCGNGSYYLLLNPYLASFREDD